MSDEEIKKLHLKYVLGNFKERFLDLVWIHSVIVKDISLQIADRLESNFEIEVNRDLVRVGALFHDIGVYNCFDEELHSEKDAPKYILHGYEGYNILKDEKIPERIARFALVHTGTGITVEDIEREGLPLPKKDYIPISLEEEIVTFADKFHSKYPSFNDYKDQKKRLEKFDLSKGIKLEVFKKKFGIPNLNELKAKYKDWEKEMAHFLDNINKK